ADSAITQATTHCRANIAHAVYRRLIAPSPFALDGVTHDLPMPHRRDKDCSNTMIARPPGGWCKAPTRPPVPGRAVTLPDVSAGRDGQLAAATRRHSGSGFRLPVRIFRHSTDFSA